MPTPCNRASAETGRRCARPRITTPRTLLELGWLEDVASFRSPNPKDEPTNFAEAPPKLISWGTNADKSTRWGPECILPARRGGDENAASAGPFRGGSVPNLDSPRHPGARGLNLDVRKARARGRCPRPRRAPLRRDGRQGSEESVSLGAREHGVPRASW